MFINFEYKRDPVKVPYSLIKLVLEQDEKQWKLKSRVKKDENISLYRKSLRQGHITRKWEPRNGFRKRYK